MKPHKWEYAEIVDDANLCIHLGYRCRACGSKNISATSLRAEFSPEDVERNKRRLKETIRGDLPAMFPKDCEEVQRLNVCKDIHDS